MLFGHKIETIFSACTDEYLVQLAELQDTTDVDGVVGVELFAELLMRFRSVHDAKQPEEVLEDDV